MVNYREIVNRFLTAYIENTLEKHDNLLSENVSCFFTNLGETYGKENVLKKLQWHHNYSFKRTTTTNILSYHKQNKLYIGLIAHHLVAFEKNNELYPLVFGGKYVFNIDESLKVITSISFVLEYQAENTIFVKDTWQLVNDYPTYELLNDFQVEQVLEGEQNQNITSKVKTLCNLFFWCLDTRNIVVLNQLTSNCFQISRDYSIGNDEFHSDKKNLSTFIKETNAYFDMNQNSIKINDIQETETFYVVLAQRLTPHRLGTKKLNSMTKYHSFFDEDITIMLSKNDLKIFNIQMKKAADVFYNGITLLEYE